MHDRRILVGGRHAECVVKSLLFNALSSRDKREAEHLGGERRDLRYIILYTDFYALPEDHIFNPCLMSYKLTECIKSVTVKYNFE